MISSANNEVKEEGEANCNKDSNDVVHVFPAAHLQLNILGSLLDLYGGFLERLTSVFGFAEALATYQSLLQVVHQNVFGLLEALSKYANFRAISRIIIPRRDKSANLVLVLSERSLCTR